MAKRILPFVESKSFPLYWGEEKDETCSVTVRQPTSSHLSSIMACLSVPSKLNEIALSSIIGFEGEVPEITDDETGEDRLLTITDLSNPIFAFTMDQLVGYLVEASQGIVSKNS